MTDENTQTKDTASYDILRIQEWYIDTLETRYAALYRKYNNLKGFVETLIWAFVVCIIAFFVIFLNSW